MQSVFYFASPFFFASFPSFPMKFLYLLCFLLPLIFWACAPDRQTLRLEGEIKGIDQADLLVCEAESSIDTVGLDTLRVRRGKFTYERPLSSPTLLTIIYPNSSTTTFVAEPGTALHLSGDANRLSEVSIKGSDNNDRVTDLRLRLLHKSTSDAQREAASFVRSHAGTLAAVAVFRAYFDEVKQRKLQPALSLLDALQKAQPQQPAVRTLVRRLRPQLLTSPDGKLPAFSAPLWAVVPTWWPSVWTPRPKRRAPSLLPTPFPTFSARSRGFARRWCKRWACAMCLVVWWSMPMAKS